MISLEFIFNHEAKSLVPVNREISRGNNNARTKGMGLSFSAGKRKEQAVAVLAALRMNVL